MTEARIPTSVWLDSHLRRLNTDAIAYYIAHRGADFSGTVIIKQNALHLGCRVLSQTRDEAGNLAWLAALGGNWVDEIDADAYIRRCIDRDPDVWVVEIEDVQKRHPFEGKIL